MRPLNISRVALAVLLVSAVSATPLSGQEWSAEQREVWEFIEHCWTQFADESFDGALACYHEDFSGWFYGEPVPRDLNNFKVFQPYYFETRNTRAYELRPIAIKVHGDVAIVHYIYIEIQELADGKENIEQGRWTDILMKDEGKWVWIGDHGGSTSQN